MRHPPIDIVVECTGHPIAAVEHCLRAFRNGKHVVNVTVEADAFCGPLLARKAAEAGVVYTLAFGDQPALICDLVDWARTCGFPRRRRRPRPQVAAALRAVDARDRVGLLRPDARAGAASAASIPKMFNSFLDGSKPSIECTAVSNATGLAVPATGLPIRRQRSTTFRSCAAPDRRRRRARPEGQVEVISSLERDGRRSPTTSASACGSRSRARPSTSATASRNTTRSTDPSGRYFMLYKRWHLIGLEVGISVAVVALRGEADRRRHLLERRRRRHRQARSQARRDARRRRRLHGVGQAAAGARSRSRSAACRSASRTT